MDRWMLHLHGFCDALSAIPYSILIRTWYSFIVIYFCFGLTVVIYNSIVPQKDGAFVATGIAALVYIPVIMYAHRLLKMIWALWLHMSVFLVMLGFVLIEKSENAAGTFLILGTVSVTVVCIRPCLGFEVFVSRTTHVNGRPPVPATEPQAV